MLYFLLKWVTLFSLKIFFRKITIVKFEEIPNDVPIIVVSNHPNTFMDALLIAAHLKRELYFLTNASAFVSPFISKILRFLNMIPVYRKQDVKEEKPDNEKVFQECCSFLRGGGALIIFPEGVSIRKRKDHKMKTGAARIAFLAESLSNFELDLKIVPIGINYSDPQSFRSDVFLYAGTPISVKSFQKYYEQDEFDAVQRLTDTIYFAITDLTLDVQDEEDDELIQNIKTIFTNQYQLEEKPSYSTLMVEKSIQNAIAFFKEKDPFLLHEISQWLRNYFYEIQQIQLTDKVIADPTALKKIYRKNIISTFLLVLLSPLFLLGWFINWVPYTLPWQIAKAITKFPEYHAPIKLLAGILSFTTWYILSFFWLNYLLNKSLESFFAVLIFPLLGFFALFYSQYVKKVMEKSNLLRQFQKNKRKLAELRSKRKKIMFRFSELQKEFESLQNQ